MSAPSLPAQFIKAAVGPAQASEREYGVPTSVALAQAILESNWAQSELTREGNAYFGIKCGKDNGKYATGCLKKPTSECQPDGTCTKVIDSFRTYATATDSFRDHGLFLASNDRYAKAFLYSANPDQFSREIALAGYATDPGYADKLIALMTKFNLYQYNNPK
ncbi:flagellar protein FlgJ [Antricoccus suffuscus]|uniref:Flagellar protein FlgJ n=2 Tax=Antricoccus suffuscus TaxID=1629062 RepID=A0A2T0ZWY8_9ACTN|nr:flagellar protein FlgJ [Antricoccus suffuscus]